MDNTKKEDTKLDRAKALASRIKGGDEQLAQDCLDFADFPPESRKEALEIIKSKKTKEEVEKKVEDKAPKATKDGDVPPTPPPPPTKEPKKEEPEAAAPAASATAAPTQNPDDQQVAPPPADVPSPKEGEKPSEDTAPKAVCDKCGKPVADCACGKEVKDCGGKEVKDCGVPPAQGATTPSIPTPVSAIQAIAGEEKKTDGKKEETPAKDCGDKAPEKVEIKVEKVEEPKPGEAIAEVIKGKEVEDQSANARIKADVKAEHDNVPPGKTAKVAQDEYVAFVAEYVAAQALATKLRPYIKETFDSAPMREIEVARLAAKHIDNLAFVADEADDEKVLLAVRGYAAAIAMDAAPVVTDAPTSTKPAIVDTPPVADVIVQDEAPKAASTAGADVKGLAAFLNN